MMAVCPECGNKHVVIWPELNPFRRGDEYYCSSNCYEVSVNRDMTKIKQGKYPSINCAIFSRYII